jgi:hypothetical protein
MWAPGAANFEKGQNQPVTSSILPRSDTLYIKLSSNGANPFYCPYFTNIFISETTFVSLEYQHIRKRNPSPQSTMSLDARRELMARYFQRPYEDLLVKEKL